MAMSLKEFKGKFREKLLEIHWKQWCTLGVASHIPPEKYWIIDLEALSVSTLVLGLQDKRLLAGCIEWLIKNREWVNSSRFKRISKIFMRPFPASNEPLITQGVLNMATDTIKKFKPVSIKYRDSNVSEEMMLRDYKKVFDAFRIRDIVKQPEILKSISLLQLSLRGYFGVGTRAEIFLYLLGENGGNSLSISREVYCDQKNIYRILEKWTETGLITKINRNYSLREKEKWLGIWRLKKKYGYLNWVKTFMLLDQLAKAISTPPWSEETYPLSSLFRDLFKDVLAIGQSLNIQVPEPASYEGALYFEPFAVTILKILERLREI